MAVEQAYGSTSRDPLPRHERRHSGTGSPRGAGTGRPDRPAAAKEGWVLGGAVLLISAALHAIEAELDRLVGEALIAEASVLTPEQRRKDIELLPWGRRPPRDRRR